MKNLKDMNTVELLTSFNVGQGKTVELPTFASIEGNVLKYNGLTANVTSAWKDAILLMHTNNLLKDQPSQRQEKLFAAYNESRLSLNHNPNQDGKTVKPIAGHVLTSTEYLHNCVKLAANVDTLESIYDLVTSVTSSQTKAELLDVLTAIQGFIVTDSQRSTIEVLAAKEESFNKVKETFKDVATLKFLSETKIQATVKLEELKNVTAKFAELGYVQYDVQFDQATMSMNLFVDNEKV